jgi:hypothetical protein
MLQEIGTCLFSQMVGHEYLYVTTAKAYLLA